MKEQALIVKGIFERIEHNGFVPRGKEDQFNRWESDLEKMIAALGLRPATAIYGASQVGKSYLANILLSHETTDIQIEFPGRVVNFQTEINPEGMGAESTGVVTRFTVSESVDADFPVTVRLLSPKDIIQMMIDGFFTDTKAEQVKSWEKPTVTGVGASPMMSRLELQDLQDHIFRNHTEKALIDNTISEGYWEETFQSINQISSNAQLMTRWFSKLWGCDESVNQLVLMLLKRLSEPQFLGATEVHCEIPTILRQGHALVNVSTLRGLFSEEGNTVLCRVGSSQISLPASELSALSKEVVLPLNTELTTSNPFLERMDVLDFPGSRTPLKGASLNLETVIDVFLRSKVRLLIQRYSESFEINNLIWCLDGGNMEERNQIADVTSWVHQCVGQNAHRRSRYVQVRESEPFAVVQTKFDKDLNVDDPSDQASKRFETNFSKEVEKFEDADWLTKWSEESPFMELHFLRDPQHSAIFKKEQDLQNRVFTESPEMDDYSAERLQKTLDNYRNNPWLQKHCRNLDQKLEGVATANRYGDESIRKFLNHASRRSGAEVNFAFRLEEICEKVSRELTGQIVSADVGVKLKQADADLNQLRNALIDAEFHWGQRQIKNEEIGSDVTQFIQSALLIQVEDVQKELHMQELGGITQASVLNNFVSSYPSVRKEMNLEERLAEFCKMRGGISTEEAEKVLSNVGLTMDRWFPEERLGSASIAVVSALEDIRKEKLGVDSLAYRRMVDCGIDVVLAEKLMKTLDDFIEDRQLASRIDVKLRAILGQEMLSETDDLVISEAIVHEWNELMFSSDSRFFDAEERDALGIIIEENIAGDLASAMIEQFTDQPTLVKRRDRWLSVLTRMMRANAKAIDVDVDRNAKLQELLDELNGLKFFEA